MSDENTTGYTSSSTDTSARSTTSASTTAAAAADKPPQVTGSLDGREIYLDDDVVWRFRD